MKVVIAGSRTIDHKIDRHYSILESNIKKFEEQYGKITLVVSGRARGADLLGELWAANNNVDIAKFPANWDLHGRSAGHIRNAEMAEFADGAIILWDGVSRGTNHMRNIILKMNKPFILDILVPTVYNTYEHGPTGNITVATTSYIPVDDPAYDA